MKTKYFISALCLAVLSAGCVKNEGGKGTTKDGFRLTVSSSKAQTKTSLGDDGLTFQWEDGDVLSLIPNGTGKIYRLQIDKNTISSDKTKADFAATAAVDAGDYRIVLGKYSTDATTITFTYGDLTVASADVKKIKDGGLANFFSVSDKLIVQQGSATASGALVPVSTLLAMPITLVTNTTGGNVTLNSVTVVSKSGAQVFPAQLVMTKADGTIVPSAAKTASLKTTFSDTPALTVGTPFTVYMAIPPVTLSDAVITVSTSAGDFTFDKSGKTFLAGYSYSVPGLDIDAAPVGPIVTTTAQWNNVMQNAVAPVTVTITGEDLVLEAGAILPSVPVTVNGNRALVLNVGTTMRSLAPDPLVARSNTRTADVVISTTNDTKTIATPLTFTGGAKLEVNGGILYAADITLGNNSQITGTGRVVMSGGLTVAENASAKVADGFIVSCDALTIPATSSLAVGGAAYYATVSGTAPANAVSKAAAQLAYSNFDGWYKRTNKGVADNNATSNFGWFIGPTDGSVVSVWSSGNGESSQNKSMGLYMSAKGCPTLPDPVNKVAGDNSLYMFSDYVKVSIVNKFAAGNIFTGTYDKTTTWFTGGIGGAALMTFGVSYDKKPVALTGYYKYQGGKINYRNNGSVTEDTDDQCDLYVVLSKKAYKVDTDLGEHGKSEDHTDGYPGGTSGDFGSDPNVLAYGRLTSADATGDFKKFRIELTYKDGFNPADAKYIIVSACSSKDGGKFTGSTDSKMWLDELELEF